MRKIYVVVGLLLFFFAVSVPAIAQPTVLGSQVVNGSYSTTNLNTVGGFKQIRLQATSSAASGARVWEFATGTAISTNYTTNWRPYTGGNTLSANAFIPVGFANGARYNTSSGGASGLLPAITSGDYYTFNVSNNSAADNVMSLLETTFNPVAISTVTQSPAVTTASTAVTVTATVASAPSAGENVFLRYTTNGFTSTTLVQMSFVGTTGTAVIPAQAAATVVSYYIYSSNRSLASINTDVTTYGQGVHDMSTLNLNNNSGSNYSYTVSSNPVLVTSTGGTSTSATYATLALAVTAINGGTIHTGTINCTVNSGWAETAPAGTGYYITATGTSANPITFTGNGAVITAGLNTAGGNMDAIFKIVGGDYITIQNFSMLENSGNTVVATGVTNTMTEFGVLLIHVSATDGAQNNTIQNNTINLLNSTATPVYANTAGIFSTSASSTTNASPGANSSLDATSTAGTNSNNKIYGNTISNVAVGIELICPPITATVFETGNDIGGTSSGTGNTINFGSAIVTTGPWNRSVATASGGIIFRNGAGNKASFNTITSANVAYAQTAGVYGIVTSSGTAPTGVTYTTTESNNNITLNNTGVTALTGIDFGAGIATTTFVANTNTINLNQSVAAASTAKLWGILGGYIHLSNTFSSNTITVTQSNTGAGANSGQVAGIGSYPGATAVTGSTQTINSNIITFKQNAPSGAGTYTGAMVYIFANSSTNAIAEGTGTISSNQFLTTGSTIRTTGSIYGIYHDYTYTTSLTMDLNTFNWDKTAATGSVYGTFSTTSGSSAAVTVTNSSFTLTGSTASGPVNVFNEQDGIGTTSTTKTINTNTVNINTPSLASLIQIFLTDYSVGTFNSNPITVTSAGSITGTVFGSNGGSFTLNNNTFSLTSSGVTPTITAIGATTISSGTYTVSNNNINTILASAAAASAPIISGVSLSAGTTNLIFGNKITGISTGAGSGSATINGIVSGGGTSNIYKNKIYDLSTANTGATTLITDILVSAGTTINIYNNLIGQTTSFTGVNSPDAIHGIGVTDVVAGSTIGVYYNTVYLTGTSTGANFGGSAIYHTFNATATKGKLDLRDNILVNNLTSSGTGIASAFRQSAALFTNYASTSNNNLFYAGSASASHLIFYDGTNSYQTIAAYKTAVASQDQASVTENPTFVSTTGSAATFLHINTTTPTQIESGGAPIAAYTDDYDGDTRNATTPDIGADEFAGTPAAVVVVNSVTASPATSQCVATARTVTATVTAGSSAISSVVLFYSLNAGAPTSVPMTLATGSASSGTSTWTGTIPASGNAAVTFYATATDAVTSKTTNGTGYQDAPNTGVTAIASSSPVSICSGTSTSLSVLLNKAGSAQVGTGATISGSGSAGFTAGQNFYGTYWGNARQQWLIKATELTAAGFAAGNITSLTMTVGVVGSPTSLTGFTINMANTAATTITTAFLTPTFTTVWGPTNYTPVVGTNTHTFTTNFLWDGTSNVIVDVCSANQVTGSSSATNNYVTPGYSCGVNYGVDGAAGAVACSTTTVTGSSLTARPAFVFAGNTPPTPTAYSWSDGTSTVGTTNPLTVSPTNATAGNIVINYTATATFSGCPVVSNATSVTVKPIPNSPTTTPSTQCGTQVPTASATDPNGYASPIFNWYAASSGGSALQSSTSPTYTSTIGTTTTLYVSVTNPAAGGCESGRTAVLITVTSPAALSAFANGSATPPGICLGPSIALTSTTPGSYTTFTWTASPQAGSGLTVGGTSGQNISVTPTVAGTYIYTVSASDGTCSNAATVTITVSALPTTPIAAASLTRVCSGTAVSLSTSAGGGSYCASPTYTNSGATGDDIGNVTFAGINNSTGDAVSDFTYYNTPAATVTGGTAYPISLTAGGASSTYQQQFGVWIDYNQNGTFEASEFVFSTSTATFSPTAATGSITIPTTAYNGTTRMRVVSQYNTALTSGQACASTLTYGETEDYNITISGATANPAALTYVWQDETNTTVGTTNPLTINPTSTHSYTVTVTNPGSCSATSSPVTVTVGPLAGIYSVGGSNISGEAGHYSTLTAAVADYNNVCLGGPVTFALTDATAYSTGETFPIIINANASASSTNTLTIKPNTGASAAITGSNASAIIKLNGADYVTIDGSNSGGTGQNLTISNTNTGTTSAVIWVASVASPADGSTNNTIKNTVLTGSGSAATFGDIMSSGSTIGSAAEAANANNTYQNNNLSAAQYGVALFGVAGNESNNVISGNTIGSTTLANKIGLNGISISNEQGVSVTDNTIAGVNASATILLAGIYVSGTISGGSISGNKISDIKNTVARQSYGLELNSSSATAGLSIFNNMIYDVSCLGTNATLTRCGHGIAIIAGGGYNLYYNTVNLNTDQGGATAVNSAIYIAAGITALDIRNNIFVNTQPTAASSRYAIYSASANTAFTNINYNDYYSLGNVGFINSSARATIVNWRTGSAQDVNSVSVDPLFVTPLSNLHLQSTSTLNALATPIAGITTDIDGDTRSVTTPDIGADEFCGAVSVSTQPITTQTVCQNIGATAISVVAKGDGLSYQWYSNAANNTTSGSPVSGATSAGYTPPTTAAGTLYYYVLITGTCGTATSTTSAVVVNPTTNITGQPSGATYCQNASATPLSLTAGGTGVLTYQWYSNAVNNNSTGSPISGAISATYVPATTTANNTTYYYVIVSGSCGTATSNTAAVIISPNANAGTLSGPSTLCTGSTGTVTTNGDTGGTFTSSNPLQVSVNASTGAVNALLPTTGTPVTITYTVTSGCNPPSTSTFNITVGLTGTAGTISGTTPLCEGQTSTFTSSGTGGGVWESDNTGVATVNASTGLVTAVSSGTANITYTLTGACIVPSSATFALTVSVDTYLGASADWFSPSNWSCSVPTAIMNVMIPASLSNYPTITTGTALAHNINIASGASVTVSGSGIFSLYGAITNNGTFDLTAGTLDLAGAGVSFGGSQITAGTVKNLTISNSGSSSISSAAADSVKVTNFLSFNTSNNTFTTNGNLTLVSSAANTASVTDITHNGATALTGNSIVGNASVERYFGVGRKWRYVAVNTIQGSGSKNTFQQNWMEGQAPGVNGGPSGYGLWITGVGGTASGFDAATTTPTIKWWNGSIFTGITDPTTYDMRQYPAYYTYVRGDRSAIGTNSTVGSTVLRTFGNLVQGDQAGVTIPAGSVYLGMGNPYASAIDLTRLTLSGATEPTAVAVWDPFLAGANGLGGYQYLTRDPSDPDPTDFEITPGGGSYPLAPFAVMNTIESGQGFFIQGGAVNHDLGFTEVSKTPHVYTPFFTAGHEQKMQGILSVKNADGTLTVADGVQSKMNYTYITPLDPSDVRKLGNGAENLSILRDGTLLAIEYRNMAQLTDTIQLNLTGLGVKNYRWTLNMTNLDSPGRLAYLVDRYTVTETALNAAGSNTIDFNVVNIPGSYAPNRFLIVFRPGGVVPVTLTTISAVRQADKTIMVNWKAENEIGINHYEVTRSATGVAFNMIGNTNPTNNAGSSAAYSLVDVAPLSGDNYYRIKAISNNGQIQYSAIVKVGPIGKDATISVYPNPVTNGIINLKFENEAIGNYQMQLSDKSGRTIHTETVTVSTGNEVKTLNLNHRLAAGAYDLTIIGPDGKKMRLGVVAE